ncbi:MAG: type IV toxin-antitoxin system AbiEi family antitoxin domain-containing protein [Geodermatophilaceae bacterium]|nr:type IV toxin-antitoxin system AbiEi family antitoxin domain-containing protein [Geodermatophilaceae bacterium]
MELRKKAGSDHGVITRAEMLTAGISRSEIDWALRRGSLLRDQRGLYAVADVPATELRRARAAVQSVGPAAQAVASHDTAARLHGINTVRQEPFAHPPFRDPRRDGAALWGRTGRVPAELRHQAERSSQPA